MDQELSSAKAWAWERINLSLHSARVLLDGLGLFCKSKLTKIGIACRGNSKINISGSSESGPEDGQLTSILEVIQILSQKTFTRPSQDTVHVCQVSLISQWILVGTCMGLNFFEVPRWVIILALFWYLHGWIFPTGTCMGGQKLYTVVHGCAWPHIPWYMDGSLFLQNWYMDGWWVVALQNSQRHTPTQTKVEYPPPPPGNRASSNFVKQNFTPWNVSWVHNYLFDSQCTRSNNRLYNQSKGVECLNLMKIWPCIMGLN